MTTTTVEDDGSCARTAEMDEVFRVNPRMTKAFRIEWFIERSVAFRDGEGTRLN